LVDTVALRCIVVEFELMPFSTHVKSAFQHLSRDVSCLYTEEPALVHSVHQVATTSLMESLIHPQTIQIAAWPSSHQLETRFPQSGSPRVCQHYSSYLACCGCGCAVMLSMTPLYPKTAAVTLASICVQDSKQLIPLSVL
jgi:hypothetical protein